MKKSPTSGDMTGCDAFAVWAAVSTESRHCRIAAVSVPLVRGGPASHPIHISGECKAFGQRELVALERPTVLLDAGHRDRGGRGCRD